MLPVLTSAVEYQLAVCRYSSYACPTCWPSDYEAVALSGCPNNTKVTYRYKEPRVSATATPCNSLGSDCRKYTTAVGKLL